jgi:hypothetical protein
MASPLIWKVYDYNAVNGKTELIAATRGAEEAAAILSMSGTGTVKVDGIVVWREGKEEQPADRSFDFAAQVMHDRRRAYHAKKYAADLARREATAREYRARMGCHCMIEPVSDGPDRVVTHSSDCPLALPY